MDIVLRDGLPFVSITVAYGGAEITVSDVVIDTGSAHTVLAAECVGEIGIVPEPGDVLYTIRGGGGAEVVFGRRLQSLSLGPQSVDRLQVEIGGLDYGFGLKGILGMDFLTAAGAVIDLGNLVVTFPAREEGD